MRTKVTFPFKPALHLAGVALFLVSVAHGAMAADQEAFVAACKQDRPASAAEGCTCVADKLGASLKDKELEFAYGTITLKAGEVSDAAADLNEAREDDIVDMTFTIMKDCGLVN